MSLPALFDTVGYAAAPGSYVSYVVLTVLGIALLARVWMIIPPSDALADEPPYLPYAVPWIGHTLPFLQNTHQFLIKATNQFHLRPFSIKVAGAKKYILTHPRDVQRLFKEATSLTFYSYAVDHLSSVYSIKDSPICSLREFFEGGKKLPDGSVTEGIHDWLRQTLSGTSLDSMAGRTIHSMEVACARTVTELPIEGAGSIEVELFSWVYQVIGHAVTAASFGQRFFDANPAFMGTLFEFDLYVPKLMLHIPYRFARRAYDSREELVQMLKTYVADDERGEMLRRDSAPFANGLEQHKKAAGFDWETRARMTLPVLQAFNTNSLPLTMWMIVYISTTPGLLKQLLEEIQPAFTSAGLDTTYLNAQATCPLFHSVFYEALRVTSGTVVSRGVDEDTNIGGYTLRKGVNIICPARTMQMSEEIWGEGAATFDPYRFVDRPQDATGHNMRAFGGGYFICPGKNFAMIMVKSAVALAITHFSFEVPDGVPKMDDSVPPIGTLKPIGAVRARISARNDRPAEAAVI